MVFSVTLALDKMKSDTLVSMTTASTSAMRWYYGDNQRMAEVEAVVIETNVSDFILSKAKVTEKTISFDELMGQQA